MKRQLRSRIRSVLPHSSSNTAIGHSRTSRRIHLRRHHTCRNRFVRKDVPIQIENEGNKFRLISKRSLSSDMDSVWRHTSTRLLETPIGSFDDPKTRTECHMAVLWWLNDAPADEGTSMAIRLLERIQKDDQTLRQNKESLDWIAGEATEDLFTTDLLNLVVNNWRKAAAEKPLLFGGDPELSASSLFERIKALEASSSTILKPDVHTFSMIMDGAIHDSRQSVIVGHDILQYLRIHATNHPRLRPNVYTFSTLMNSWVKSGRAEAPDKVEELLEQMHELSFEEPEWDVAPNQVTYATAIDCWAQKGRPDRVEFLLQEMYEESRNGNEELKPALACFNGYLVALAKAGDVDKAQSVLDQMERLYESGELNEQPSVISYSTVLSAFAKSKTEPEVAESILRRMIDQDISPNVISYNSVINAYVNSRNIERAEELLGEMHQSFLQGNIEVRPTVQTYTVVLSGWSKLRSSDAGERGERLLRLMRDLANSGELDSPPDIVAYNAVLDCWAKSRSRDAMSRAQALIRTMESDGIKPDVYSYNILIRSFARARKIAEAEGVLKTMMDAGVEPDITSYNTLLDAWSKSTLRQATARIRSLFRVLKKHERLEPDLVTYNTLLHSYTRRGYGEQAQSLLDEMCGDGSRVRPDSISFNTVISAWAHSTDPEAPQRAEAILERMIEIGGRVRPDVISFNSVMGAWVRSRSPKAFQRCEKLVAIMHEMRQEGYMTLKPDPVTFNTLISTCGLMYSNDRSLDETAGDGISGDDLSENDVSPSIDPALQAESILEEMKGHYDPDGKTYGAIINVWSRSHAPESGEKAEAYLRELIGKVSSGRVNENLRAFEFTSTIRAWGNSGDPNAIYKADEILHLLLQYNQQQKKIEENSRGTKTLVIPDKFLFHAILKVLAASNVHDKPKYADRLLQLMKEYEVKPSRAIVQLLEVCYRRRVEEMTG
ncbi:unnamed protein product [Cylindrotheca closterium]|uniref:Pentacotripeptide-repeat region of PRORP domain-containing protein n=1 Tax=Cylindrotheca closterium TaxID=2856 RepID=A0AAD2PWH6_9STRA|nr:unnamed protein product [Cylindrotheca closterium]